MNAVLQSLVASGQLWQLRTARGHAEIRSTSEKGRWLALFWTEREHAEGAIPALKPWFEVLDPQPFRLDRLVREWLYGMHLKGVLLGLSWTSQACMLEIEPLALMGWLADLVPAYEELSLRLPTDLFDALLEAKETPPAVSRGVAGALEPVPQVRKARISDPVEARRLLSCLGVDQIRALAWAVGGQCDHTLDGTRAWAEAEGVDADTLERQIRRLGLRCDCEVCFNLPEVAGVEA